MLNFEEYKQLRKIQHIKADKEKKTEEIYYILPLKSGGFKIPALNKEAVDWELLRAYDSYELQITKQMSSGTFIEE